MSNLVTFEQQQMLDNIGLSKKSNESQTSFNTSPYGDSITRGQGGVSFLFVHDALDWIREKKRVICAVDVDYFDGWYYTGKYLDRSKIDLQYTNSFDDHYNAESALLTAVLEYLIEKEK